MSRRQQDRVPNHDQHLTEPGPALTLDQQVLVELFAFAPDGIVVVDHQGVVSQINGRTERMFGFKREELVGQPVEVLLPERFARVHKRHRRHYLSEPHIRPLGVGLELLGRRKDGSEFPVDIMLSPVKTDRGTQVLAIIRDITERKQVESQVSETREMFFRLFEYAPDAILVIDADGFINRANAKTEELLGYSREELLGKPVELLIPERFAARHVNHRTAYLQSPRTRPMGAGLELFARRKDGSEFPVDIMLSPIEMGQGNLVLGVIRDVTERKAAEDHSREALRREMLLKEEIHHRVKNNLQVISSLVYLQSLNISDATTLDILKDCQSRVKSIALVHEKLYRSDEIEQVSFDDNIYLPAVQEDTQQPEFDASAINASPGQGTVLLVEDDKLVRDCILAILQARGYTVLEASSSEEALAICRDYEGTINLLVTDVVMPGMGGGQLAAYATELRKSMKVLYISGYPNEIAARRGIEEASVPFLQKPFTPDALAQKVREILDHDP